MRLPYFDVIKITNISELLENLGKEDANVKILAGGTDLIPRLRYRLLSPSLLLSIKELTELKGINQNSSFLEIGAVTTLKELISSPIVSSHFKAVKEAAESVAAPPIWNMATVGGNICQDTRCLFYNQSPFWRKEHPPCKKAGGEKCLVIGKGQKCFSVYQGDLAPALMAFNSKIEIIKNKSTKTIEIEDIFSGRGDAPLSLSLNEFLSKIFIPFAGKCQVGSAYEKLRLRKALDYPLISVAAVLLYDKESNVLDLNLGYSGVGPKPFLLKKSIEFNKRINEFPSDLIKDITAEVLKKSQMVNNLFVPATYRREMIPIFTKKAIDRAWKQLNSNF